MKNKGFTLIEVTVAMGIFSVVSLLVIGSVLMVLNLKTLTRNTKETQQKLRIAMEMISRDARQSKSPIVSADGKTLTLTFSNTAVQYYIWGDATSPYNLGKRSCLNFDTQAGTCMPGQFEPTGIALLGGLIELDPSSGFTRTKGEPLLYINLNGSIKNISDNPFYTNDFSMETAVFLEQEGK
jgi:prepilin-type N-terminal cleavage/methylation domain-containing protein